VELQGMLWVIYMLLTGPILIECKHNEPGKSVNFPAFIIYSCAMERGVGEGSTSGNACCGTRKPNTHSSTCNKQAWRVHGSILDLSHEELGFIIFTNSMSCSASAFRILEILPLVRVEIGTPQTDKWISKHS